jgi:hypothetical protein
MSDLCIFGCNQNSLWASDQMSKQEAAAKTAKTSGTEKTTATSAENPLAAEFGQILEEAITGLTEVVAQAASKRVAEFMEDRSRLRAIAQAAGWTPAAGSSAGDSSTSSTTTSNSTGSGGNDPVYRLLTALGETVIQALQQAEQAAASSVSATQQGDPAQTSTSSGTSDSAATDAQSGSDSTTASEAA